MNYDEVEKEIFKQTSLQKYTRVQQYSRQLRVIACTKSWTWALYVCVNGYTERYLYATTLLVITGIALSSRLAVYVACYTCISYVEIQRLKKGGTRNHQITTIIIVLNSIFIYLFDVWMRKCELWNWCKTYWCSTSRIQPFYSSQELLGPVSIGTNVECSNSSKPNYVGRDLHRT